MTHDNLAGKVAQLLSERRPRPARRPKGCEFSASPLGRAQVVLRLAQDLVIEAHYVAAEADWEQRHCRLRGLQDELSAGVVVGARREALRAEVENLRVRGWARWLQTATLHLQLAVASRRAQTIILRCKERQAAITATAQASTEDMTGRARADLIANQMTTRDRIDAETRCVLGLHEGTAAISVAELYAVSAEKN
jgi:hypothetical protein